MSAFGDLVKERRETLHWTQKELAERARIHPVTLNKLERGVNNPHSRTVATLSIALGLHRAEVAAALPGGPPPAARGPELALEPRLPLPGLAPVMAQEARPTSLAPSLQEWRDAGAQRLLNALGRQILGGENELPSQAWGPMLAERFAAFHDHVSAVEELAELPQAM